MPLLLSFLTVGQVGAAFVFLGVRSKQKEETVATNTSNTMKTTKADGGVEVGMGERLLYTIDSAREMLGGLARSYLYELMARGVLSSVKVGRRRMIARRDLEEFVERLREGAA